MPPLCLSSRVLQARQQRRQELTRASSPDDCPVVPKLAQGKQFPWGDTILSFLAARDLGRLAATHRQARNCCTAVVTVQRIIAARCVRRAELRAARGDKNKVKAVKEAARQRAASLLANAAGRAGRRGRRGNSRALFLLDTVERAAPAVGAVRRKRKRDGAATNAGAWTYEQLRLARDGAVTAFVVKDGCRHPSQAKVLVIDEAGERVRVSWPSCTYHCRAHR